MSIFGPVLGDLPLLHLPPAKIVKLDDRSRLDLIEQVEHNCLRRGWLSSMRTDVDVRTLIDIEVGRAHVVLADVRGDEIGILLEMEMEHARWLNEYRACFGFFLQDEIDHLSQRKFGPLLLKSLSAEYLKWGPSMLFGPFLENLLTGYRRWIKTDRLCRETNSFVQQLTGLDPLLDGVPSQIQGFFELARLTWEIVEAEPIGAKSVEPASNG